MWQTIDQKLYQKYVFTDFAEALGFIVRVGLIAERLNHHPTIHNTWNTVELWLASHDKGDVATESDHELARLIDEMKPADNGHMKN